jgi:hypothetical protein
MVSLAAPSPRRPTPGHTEPDASEFGFDDPDNLTEAERQAFQRKTRQRDPSPEEIAEACAEIRKGWSEAEHRYRAGMAPVDPLARGRLAKNLDDFGGVRGWKAPTVRFGLPEVLRGMAGRGMP